MSFFFLFISGSLKTQGLPRSVRKPSTTGWHQAPFLSWSSLQSLFFAWKSKPLIWHKSQTCYILLLGHFSPLGKTAPQGNCCWEKKKRKKDSFISKEECQVLQNSSKIPTIRGYWTKAVVQRQKILFSPNTSKRKCRHHHSSHILLSSISRKLVTKASCNYHALQRPDSAEVVTICFEQDAKFVKSLPLCFSTLGHFPHSSGLSPPWGLCHRFHRSCHCNPGQWGTQRPSSHCTAVPGAEPAHQSSGFFLKGEHAVVTAFTS